MYKEMFDLEERTVVITGAAKGIGRAIAAGFAEYRCGLFLIDKLDLSATVRDLKPAAKSVEALQADLTDKKEISRIVEAVFSVFPHVDVLVNNAGMIRRSPVIEYKDGDWDSVMDLNARASFFLAKEIGQKMLERGRGKIINMASIKAYQSGVRQASYAASKAAIVAFTRALANEWAAKGINVNAVAPGVIETDSTKEVKDDPRLYEENLLRIPQGRWGQAEEVVGPVLFLSSDASNYMNGCTILVDGGWMGR